MSTARAVLLVAFVAVAAQATALRDVLIWDDVMMLKTTDLYTNPARWLESVTMTLGRGETFYWRPAATTSFLLESTVHGGAGWGYRLTQSLLHGATCGVAYVLLARLLANRTAALLAALAFALHPVNVEAVVWPSARFDVLVALLSLAALATIPADGAPARRWLVPAGFAALATFSKESAIVLPVVSLAWMCALGGTAGRALYRPAAWIAGGVAVVLFLRLEAIGYLFRTRPASVDEAGTALQHLLLVGRSVATSVETLLVPWGTVGPAHRGVRPIPPGDGLGWIGVLVGVALVAVTAVAVMKRRRVGWLLAAFLVTLAPASQIVPLDVAGGLHSADRFLYLPSFFAVATIAVLVSDALASRPASARTAGIAAAVVVAGLAAGRFVALRDWRDPISFWTRAAEMAPDADAIMGGLAVAEYEEGRLEDAETHARLAGPYGTQLLVEILVRQGRGKEAVEVLDRQLAEIPDDGGLHLQRGEILYNLGRLESALQDFQQALRIQELRARSGAPAMLTARALADIAEAEAGSRPDVARERIERAEALADSRDPVTWVRITRAWIALRDPARAQRAYANAERAGAPGGDLDRLREGVRRITEGEGGGGR